VAVRVGIERTNLDVEAGRVHGPVDHGRRSGEAGEVVDMPCRFHVRHLRDAERVLAGFHRWLAKSRPREETRFDDACLCPPVVVTGEHATKSASRASAAVDREPAPALTRKQS
jgi:hypothetical protein